MTTTWAEVSQTRQTARVAYEDAVKALAAAKYKNAYQAAHANADAAYARYASAEWVAR